MQPICRYSIEIRCHGSTLWGFRSVKVISCADRWILQAFGIPLSQLIQLTGVERPIWWHLKAWVEKLKQHVSCACGS